MKIKESYLIHKKQDINDFLKQKIVLILLEISREENHQQVFSNRKLG